MSSGAQLTFVPVAVFVMVPFCFSLARKAYNDFVALKFPEPYIDLDTNSVGREVRPTGDVLIHLFLFKYQVLGDGYVLQKMLERWNQQFLTWDIPFTEQGLEPVEVLEQFCNTWGISTCKDKWQWSKPLEDYETMNEFFCRRYAAEKSPENPDNLGASAVVSPVTATVTVFPSVASMPVFLKNRRFSIKELGIPDWTSYLPHIALLFYLAPSDYHCFHSPVEGKVTHLQSRNEDRYSITVKSYVLSSTNILTRNRAVVAVLETASGGSVCMIIIGGVTVDSIRLEETFKVGSSVRKGQLVGCFARGGSCVVLLFDRETVLEQDLRVLTSSFRLPVGKGLASFV